jgi:hypothetical protein
MKGAKRKFHSIYIYGTTITANCNNQYIYVDSTMINPELHIQNPQNGIQILGFIIKLLRMGLHEIQKTKKRNAIAFRPG